MKTIFKDLNRALIKRLELLPNIFEFKTEKYSIHEYAAVYGIEKILRRTYAQKLLVSKPNRYLERQYHRLTQYAAAGQREEFNYLSEVIIRKSVSYRILALNRTIADWHIKPIRELRRIWRSLSYISRTLSSDLKFKRVWIDKKPGDYARPLGVPTPAWRCYSFMWMDHIERYFKASGQLATWQHGGRSGVGVLTCYKALIPRLKEEEFIYEFDIKGFFDNISHEKIRNQFYYNLGPKVGQWVQNILSTKPEKYVLPDITADKAALKYNQIKANEDITAFDHLNLSPLALSRIAKMKAEGRIESLLDRPDTRGIDDTEFGFIIFPGSNDKMIKYIMENKIPFEIAQNYVCSDEVDAWDRTEAKYKPIIPKDQYKGLMNDETFSTRLPDSIAGIRPMEDMTEEQRALGRDNWKNLGQPGSGVPQGLNTSPFMSTILTDVYLASLGRLRAIIMYMDDGLLFAKTKEEMNRRIQLLKEELWNMGLEIEPSKSGLVKENGVWNKSLKFLGLRYLPETDTLMSDTRSGTKVEFPTQGNWEDIKQMAQQNQLSTPYMRKVFDKLINTQAYEAGLKYGFLGCLIAGSQYKEAKTTLERKQDIVEGQGRAWKQISESKGFIWKHQDLMNHAETLTNVSSIAVHRFAEFNRLGYKLHIRKGSKVRRGGRI